MAKLSKKIVIKKINELVVYGNNPRINDEAVDAVAASIQAFVFRNPILIDSNNVIVAGHTRLKASQKLGIEEVPCIVIDDLTDDEVRALRLADNKTAELARWDMGKLSEEIKNIDMDLLQFGFEDLLDKLDDEPEEDDFAEDEELPEVPYSQKGDLFLLGNHRLICGDSTKLEDVKTLVGEAQVDLLFTDPPYNVDYEGSTGMKIQNDKQDNDSFFKFLTSAFQNAFEVLKPGAAFYVCHSDVEELNFLLAVKNAGFHMSQIIIWLKNSLVLGRKDYHSRNEPILYGWKEGAGHYFIDDRTQDTIWEYDKPKHNDLHPTMKPIPLVARAIKNSSRRGENVLDLFGGSGTTLIAAEQDGRNAFLVEIDEKYVDVIVKRYIRYIGSLDGCFLIRNGEKIPLSEIEDYQVLQKDEELSDKA